MFTSLVRDRAQPPPLRAYAESLLMVAASTIAGALIAPQWGNGPVDLLYIPAILGSAISCGLGPSILSAAASTLAYNFFFTAPQYTLLVRSPADAVTMVSLFLVALVTSHMAAATREQRRLAQAHAERNATIAGLAGRLLSCGNHVEIATATVEELSRLFQCNAILLNGVDEPELVASAPDTYVLNPGDKAAAVLTLGTGASAGRGVERANLADWQFHAVTSDRRVMAAIGMARNDGAPPVRDDQLPLLGSLLDQVALALDRARLEKEALDFAATRERDRVRSVLVAAIGEDLKPRLAAIMAANRAMRRGAPDSKALIATVGSEAAKLDRYIDNLVDLSPASDQKPLIVGGVTIDLFQRTVHRGDAAVHLTPKEFAVLAELAKQPGRVLSHAHLLRSVWGPAQERQIEYLRVAVGALRHKLERDPARPALIINEPAVGYRLANSA